jgi:hypothetical protein
MLQISEYLKGYCIQGGGGEGEEIAAQGSGEKKGWYIHNQNS